METGRWRQEPGRAHPRGRQMLPQSCQNHGDRQLRCPLQGLGRAICLGVGRVPCGSGRPRCSAKWSGFRTICVVPAAAICELSAADQGRWLRNCQWERKYSKDTQVSWYRVENIRKEGKETQPRGRVCCFCWSGAASTVCTGNGCTWGSSVSGDLFFFSFFPSS